MFNQEIFTAHYVLGTVWKPWIQDNDLLYFSMVGKNGETQADVSWCGTKEKTLDQKQYVATEKVKVQISPSSRLSRKGACPDYVYKGGSELTAPYVDLWGTSYT